MNEAPFPVAHEASHPGQVSLDRRHRHAGPDPGDRFLSVPPCLLSFGQSNGLSGSDHLESGACCRAGQHNAHLHPAGIGPADPGPGGDGLPPLRRPD